MDMAITIIKGDHAVRGLMGEIMVIERRIDTIRK
jgi:hypothetical protein